MGTVVEDRVGNVKILILSDVHYPSTNEKVLAKIIREEKAGRLIFLGDTLQDGKYLKECLEFVRNAGGTNFTFIHGDEDPPGLGEAAAKNAAMTMMVGSTWKAKIRPNDEFCCPSSPKMNDEP